MNKANQTYKLAGFAYAQDTSTIASTEWVTWLRDNENDDKWHACEAPESKLTMQEMNDKLQELNTSLNKYILFLYAST
jgi:hypothetical protein